jgi:hypothetical protein
MTELDDFLNWYHRRRDSLPPVTRIQADFCARNVMYLRDNPNAGPVFIGLAQENMRSLERSIASQTWKTYAAPETPTEIEEEQRRRLASD